MRKSISALAACLLLSGVMVAGCGGGSDSTSSGGGEVASNAGAEGKEGEAPSGAGGSPNGGEPPGDGESPSAGESSNGGGGESDGAASTAKKEFVAKANALCDKRRQKMRSQLGKILEGAQKGGSQEAVLQQMVEKVAPGMEGEADELRKLEAPSGDGAKIEAIAAAIDATAAEIREDPKVVQTSVNVFKDAQRVASGYGLDTCARAS